MSSAKQLDSSQVEAFRDSSWSISSIPDRIAFRKYTLKLAESVGMSIRWKNEYVRYFIAQDYSRLGDFNRSLEVYRFLLDYFQSVGDFENVCWTLNDMAVVHNNLHDYSASNALFMKALETCIEHNLKELLPDIYDGLSSTFSSMGKWKEAEKYFALEESIIISETRIHPETKTYYYFGKAEHLRRRRMRKEAISYYQKCILLGDQYNIRKTVHAKLKLASLYEELNQNEKALGLLQEVELHFKKENQSSDPYLLFAMIEIGKYHQNQGRLKQAFEYINEAETIAAELHINYVFSMSKFILDDIRRENLERGVEVAYALSQAHRLPEVEALFLAERAKSNVLNQRRYAAIAGNSGRINQRTKDLRYTWLFELKVKEDHEDHRGASVLRNRIDSLEKTVGLHQQKDFDHTQLLEIQQSLQDDELIIKYFMTEASLFVFEIDHQTIKTRRLDAVSSDLIIRYYQLLKNPETSHNSMLIAGKAMFEQLGLTHLTTSHLQKLRIVPDQDLSYISFATLPLHSDFTNWGNFPFLMRRFNLTYDFSLQTMVDEEVGEYSAPYVGISPHYSGELFTPLLHGDKIVEKGRELFGGTTWLGHNATSSQFREKGIDARFLQLYAHGRSNDTNFSESYVRFSDANLSVDEILSLPVKTDLCFLSACDVGIGQQFEGEGVTSIAWAFRASGANNVVQSLWKINQDASLELINSFYTHLGSNSSDIALCQSQKEYLNNPEISLRQKHPFYWAGLAHYGSGSFVAYQKRFSFSTTLLVVSLIGSIAFAFWFIRSRASNSI